MPFDIVNSEVAPVLIDLPGWTLPAGGVKDMDQLPSELTEYINFVEKELGVPIVIVSVGPDRKETLARHAEFAWLLNDE